MILPSKEVVIKKLIENGFSDEQANIIYNTINDLSSLANYYNENIIDKDVPEREVETFLVTPLLQALGWPVEQIKMNIANTDIVLIRKPCQDLKTWDDFKENADIIIEAKAFYWYNKDELASAYNQVLEKYIHLFPLVQTIVVTSGAAFKSYLKKESGFTKDSNKPDGKLDLLSPFAEDNIKLLKHLKY